MRGVLIDIGGVLVPNRLVPSIEAWSESRGIDGAELAQAVYSGNDDTVLIGRVTEDEWWTGTVAARTGMAIEDIASLRRHLDEDQQWDDRLVSFVRGLRPRVRMGILSNAWPSQRLRMEARGLIDVVDELLLSCEIGFAKPAESAFAMALERMGINASDLLFVDDEPGHVAVAQRLGLHGLVHKDTPSTVASVMAFVETA